MNNSLTGSTDFDAIDAQYVKPSIITDHVKQTALGVFFGLAAWSLLCGIVFLICWLLR